jgi:predicted PurR-regulated permease PerM
LEFNKKNVRAIMILIIFTVLLYMLATHLNYVIDAIVYIINVSKAVIAGLCMAFVMNVILNPVENVWFKFMKNSNKRFVRKMLRPVSIIVTFLVIIGFLSVVLLVIVPEISDTVTTLVTSIPRYLKEAVNWVEKTLASFNVATDFLPELTIDWDNVVSTITAYLADGSSNIINTATNITSSVVGGIFNAIFSFILAIYVLAQKEKLSAFLKRFMRAFLNKKLASRIVKVLTISNEMFTNFIRYQCLDALILGVLCFIGMSIFRFPYALVISVIVTLTALIPVVGAITGEIIGTLIIFTVSPLKGLLFLAFLLILQQLETSIIYPKVVGQSVGLPPVIVLSAVLIGGNIGGVFGALVATPISAVAYVLLKYSIAKRIKKKEEKEQLAAAKESGTPANQ